MVFDYLANFWVVQIFKLLQLGSFIVCLVKQNSKWFSKVFKLSNKNFIVLNFRGEDSFLGQI